MLIQPRPPLTIPALISPLVAAVVLVGLCALLREPARQRFSAIFLAGAGAAYLSGGFGIWEFAFCALITLLAYRGLDSYRTIALGWVLHTCWDAAHHLYGNPIIPFAPLSSVGCAICDLGIAAYYYAGAPDVWRRGTRVRAAGKDTF